MLNRLLSFIGMGGRAGTSEGLITRRKYARHAGFNVDVLVNAKKFHVHDWSLGGVSFEVGGDSSIKIGDKLQVIMEFKFIDNDISISQNAQVIRIENGNCVAEFDLLPQAVRLEFDRVLETLYTQSFIESQTLI